MESYFIRKISNYDIKNKKYKHLYYNGNTVIPKHSIDRVINNIYIPPAYDNVKINKNLKSKVLAIGYDAKDRAQKLTSQHVKCWMR